MERKRQIQEDEEEEAKSERTKKTTDKKSRNEENEEDKQCCLQFANFLATLQFLANNLKSNGFRAADRFFIVAASD